MHMLPTPASIQAQTNTRLLKGRTGLWFAGGYLFPYDAQETALLSAIEVANGRTAAARHAATHCRRRCRPRDSGRSGARQPDRIRVHLDDDSIGDIRLLMRGAPACCHAELALELQ